ncbi:MAG: hypothetical protein M1827_003307 [Pycnora praestabilis]|nr:MAG: hypothetical protein M1827_003307 [Pycnora praestabilis]
MSEFHTPAEEVAPAFPTSAEPTIEQTPIAADPIRTTGTDTMTPESRPEINGVADSATNDSTAKPSIPDKMRDVARTEDVVVQSTPASEGILGYKAPGLLKSLRFTKNFFWFGDEAIAPKDLHHYLRGEKPEIANRNAAWSSQTGKGLLLHSKTAELKAQPAGIINLTDISDVTKEGSNEFFFKLHGQKHTFQASSLSERDSWLVALESKSSEAKTSSQGILGSAGYKQHMEKFGKPVALAAAPVAAKAEGPTTKKTTDVSAPETLPKDNVVSSRISSSDEERKNTKKSKSRSVSRKRGSIFGSLLGKKEEHEEKKDVKKEDKIEEIVDKKEIKREEKEEKIEKEEIKEAKLRETTAVEHAPFDAAAIAARVVEAPIAPIEGSQPIVADEVIQASAAESRTAEPSAINTATRDAPKTSKRNSIFGNFFQKKDVTSPTEEKVEKEVAPVVPAKDIEAPITTSAENRDESLEPVADGIESTPAAAASNERAEPIASNVENLEPPAEATTALPAATAAPVTTVPAATAPDAVKEKRRSSFFGTLGGRKDRRSDSDNGVVDSAPKQRSPSPLPKLGGLFRNPSRAMKGNKDAVKKDAAPVAPSTEKATNDMPIETNGDAAPVASEASNIPLPSSSRNEGENLMGDVVPNAGHAQQSTPSVSATA